MGFRQYDRIPFSHLIDDWNSYLSDAGQALEYALEWRTPAVAHYSSQSLSMMARMGWRPGKGLGKNMDGRTSPVEVQPPPRGGGRGGASKSKRVLLVPASKVSSSVGSQPPPRGGGRGGEGSNREASKEAQMMYAHEPAPGKLVYGKKGDRNGAEVLEVWDVTPRGRAYPTGETVMLVSDWGVRASELRRALMWGGGPVGVAETTFPHPRGWHVSGTPKAHTLEEATVRTLTAVLRTPHETEPTCETVWPGKVGPVVVSNLYKKVCNPLLTPRDFKSWYLECCIAPFASHSHT